MIIYDNNTKVQDHPTVTSNACNIKEQALQWKVMGKRCNLSTVFYFHQMVQFVCILNLKACTGTSRERSDLLLCKRKIKRETNFSVQSENNTLLLLTETAQSLMLTEIQMCRS